MKKRLYKTIVTLYVVSFLSLLAFQTWSLIRQTGNSVSSLIYWMIIIGWMAVVYHYKKESSFSLSTAFALLIIAALFVIFGLSGISEILMKVSLIGWVVGIAHSLVESRKVT